MHRLKAWTFLLLIVTLSSCEVINPKEDLPAYITVRNPQVLVDSADQFYSSLGIKNAWIYHESNLLGTFEFPTTFPYINIDKGQFELDGGVYESGLSSFRVPYPFWRRHYYNIYQEALDTLVIEPVFEYMDDDFITYAYVEDFEDISLNFAAVMTKDTANFYRTATDSYQGNYCGMAVFDDDSRQMELVSDELPFIPRNIDCWAELTYKTDIPFAVGLYWIDGSPYTATEVTFSPTNGEWKTVYVHMVSLIRLSPNDPLVQKGLWIKAVPDSLNGNLYLDNIRLIHFK